MTLRSRVATPFVLAVVALGLAACGSDPTTDPTSTVTVTEPGGSLAPEQQELRPREITAALPTRDEVPLGYESDPGADDPKQAPESERTTDPASCLALYLDTPDMRDFATDHVTAAERVRYSDEGSEGIGVLIVTIWTHDELYPTRFLDAAGAALGDCARFDSRNRLSDATSPNRAATITTPLLGDQTFGVRVGAPTGGVTVDDLWVASGHNLINVHMVTGHDQDNSDILESTAQQVLEDLSA